MEGKNSAVSYICVFFNQIIVEGRCSLYSCLAPSTTSACEKDAPAVSNAVIIAAANSFFSLIAGFAIFGVSEVHGFLYIY